MSDLKIFATDIEDEAVSQISELASLPPFENSKIRIMADAHAGKGCVIGFTADLGDKVIPNVVGVDIGCGVLAQWLPIAARMLDERFFETLDRIIHEEVPAGPNVHRCRKSRFDALKDLKCFRSLKDTKRIERAIGTLGSGNHFIELDKGATGCWLVIHTGSRNLGKQVAEHYQNLAIDMHRGGGDLLERKNRIISEYKEQGRKNEIQGAIEKLYREYRSKQPDIKPELCWLEGQAAEDYMHDMFVCQRYAAANRYAILRAVTSALGLSGGRTVESVHNYIEPGTNITRKGAISAECGEDVVIPLNMAEGCIIGHGTGNEDYNRSAPHGAGRAMSRKKARESLDLADYESAMDGVFSTCVGEGTIDEAPMAYKPPEAILDGLSATVKVEQIVRPVYSFKAV